MSRNRRDTSQPNGNLLYQAFKVGLKGQSHMFGRDTFSTQKIKQKNNFLGMSWSSFHFFN